MKVLHLFDHSIPLHSGYTFRSRAILQHQRKMGIETCHVTSPKQGETEHDIETVDELTFYRTKVPSHFASKLPILDQLCLVPAMKKRLLEVIAIEKPDVIHAHSPALNGLAAIQAGKATGLPVVYEIRAFWEDAAVDHGTCKEGDIRYRMTKALESYVIRKADAVTTICEGLRKDIISRGVNAKKVTTIWNAVNTEQFELIKQKDLYLEKELGLDGKQVIGFLGSFYAYEGLDLLIEALPSIIQKLPNTRVLLVGGGPQEQALKAQISQLGMSSYVIMPGRVPHKDVNLYYSLVDLLVYPRKSMRLTELVTPLKPLEAMAQGKVLLASDVGGHHELIEHEKTGWLFEADSASALATSIINLLSKPEQFPTIVTNGRNFVDNIRNWKNTTAPYTHVYESIGKGK